MDTLITYLDWSLTMKSLFASRCKACGHPIAKGDEIARNAAGVWQHAVCPNGKPTPKPKRPKATKSQIASAAVQQPAPAIGDKHPVFKRVLDHAVKLREPVYLCGPKGCGKTTLVEHLAAHLGRDYGFLPCSGGITEADILGRRETTAAGGWVYRATEFVRIYENGGVFLFDELDGIDPNVSLCVNAAFANGKLSLPKRHEKPIAHKHADCVLIGAGNTPMRGASREYAGRNSQDGAFFDRFSGIGMDYDYAIEARLCPCNELRDTLYRWRDNAKLNKVSAHFGTRQVAKAYQWKVQLGADIEYVKSIMFFGLSADEIRKVEGN